MATTVAPKPASANVGALVGFGFLGAILGLVYTILWFRHYFFVLVPRYEDGEKKKGPCKKAGDYFDLFIWRPLLLILSIVFFAKAFKSNLQSDPTPAYNCVANTIADYGSNNICQQVVSICSLQPVPVFSQQQCVQIWLGVVAFSDAVIHLTLIGSTIYLFLFMSIPCFKALAMWWIDLWARAFQCCCMSSFEWRCPDVSGSDWAKHFFFFSAPLLDIVCAILGFIDGSKNGGCYAAHCSDFVSGTSEKNITLALEYLSVIAGPISVVYFVYELYSGTKHTLD